MEDFDNALQCIVNGIVAACQAHVQPAALPHFYEVIVRVLGMATEMVRTFVDRRYDDPQWERQRVAFVLQMTQLAINLSELAFAMRASDPTEHPGMSMTELEDSMRRLCIEAAVREKQQRQPLPPVTIAPLADLIPMWTRTRATQLSTLMRAWAAPVRAWNYTEALRRLVATYTRQTGTRGAEMTVPQEDRLRLMKEQLRRTGLPPVN